MTPSNNPKAIKPSGEKFAFDKLAIRAMIRNTPQVIANAIPINFQSTKIVSVEKSTPTNTA